MKNIVYVLCNFSGNVGKTTLARNGFVPRLGLNERPEQFFAIETVNSGTEDLVDRQMPATKTREILSAILRAQLKGPVVADVGASNAEEFLRQFRELKAMVPLITKVVIPCIADAKVVKDTISTAGNLLDIGLPPARIAVAITRLKPDSDRRYLQPLRALEDLKVMVAKSEIHENQSFPDASRRGIPLSGLVNLSTDPLALLTSGELGDNISEEEIENLTQLSVSSAGAINAQEQLDALLDELQIPKQ